ncbi:hypothetical protein BKA70DRAFT_1309090, partial [Coprinopsis sp. MPI-PUGE-AT-0042]
MAFRTLLVAVVASVILQASAAPPYVPLHGRCGGIGYRGPKECIPFPNVKCVVINPCTSFLPVPCGEKACLPRKPVPRSFLYCDHNANYHSRPSRGRVLDLCLCPHLCGTRMFGGSLFSCSMHLVNCGHRNAPRVRRNLYSVPLHA